MPQLHHEDLFENTKMSFGEHLEELRICLVKAILGLTVGFLVGLWVAGPVVEMIEGPLKRNLATFHFNKMKGQLETEYGKLSTDVEDFMRERGFVFQNVYWETAEVQRLAGILSLPPGPAAQPNPTETNPTETNPGEAKPTATVVPAEAGAGLVIQGGDPQQPTATMIKTRIWRPMDANITSLSAHEPFMIWIKAAVITGAILSSPWIFLQIWTFVAAGLYPHEKGYVYFFMPFSLGLFFAGAAMAFFFVFDPVLEFLFTFNLLMNIDPDPRISEWMSFVLLMPLAFGVSFQLPLVMMIIERLGIVSVSTYLDKWRISVLGIFVLSMILTPADPVSMLLMAVPLTFLYFGGILLCRYAPRRSSPYGVGYDPE